MRKPLPTNQRKVAVGIRLPANVKAYYERTAQHDHRTLSSAISIALEEAMANHENRRTWVSKLLHTT